MKKNLSIIYVVVAFCFIVMFSMQNVNAFEGCEVDVLVTENQVTTETTTESSEDATVTEPTTEAEDATNEEETTTTEEPTKPEETTKPVYEVESVKLSATKFSYNGKNQYPKITVKNTFGKKLTEGKSYTVKFSENSKTVGTYKVTVKFKGNYSGEKTLTYKIVPKNISNLKYEQTQKKIKTTKISWAYDDVFDFEEYWEKGYSYTMVGTNGIVLNWDKVKGATGYRLYIYKNGDWTKVKNLTKTTYTNSNITPGKAYKYAIKAYQKVDGKYYYSKDFISITAALSPESTPIKIKIKNNKAYLTWDKKVCTGYVLYLKFNNGSNKKVYIKDSNITKYTYEYPDYANKIKVVIKAYTQTDNTKLVSASKSASTNITPTATKTDTGIAIGPIKSDEAKKIVAEKYRGLYEEREFFEGKSADGKRVVVYHNWGGGWSGIDSRGAFYDEYGKTSRCWRCGKIKAQNDGKTLCDAIGCTIIFGYTGESS